MQAAASKRAFGKLSIQLIEHKDIGGSMAKGGWLLGIVNG